MAAAAAPSGGGAGTVQARTPGAPARPRRFCVSCHNDQRAGSTAWRPHRASCPHRGLTVGCATPAVLQAGGGARLPLWLTRRAAGAVQRVGSPGPGADGAPGVPALFETLDRACYSAGHVQAGLEAISPLQTAWRQCRALSRLPQTPIRCPITSRHPLAAAHAPSSPVAEPARPDCETPPQAPPPPA